MRFFSSFSPTSYSVQLNQVQNCHVIDHEQHLLHVVHSHCKYSLQSGFGGTITYDLPALEKHILDRFIYGKPYIKAKISMISFKSDVMEAEKFSNVRRNVPQVRRLLVS